VPEVILIGMYLTLRCQEMERCDLQVCNALEGVDIPIVRYAIRRRKPALIVLSLIGRLRERIDGKT
jgi:hypothetical protein